MFSVELRRLPGGGDVTVGTRKKRWRDVDTWMDKRSRGAFILGQRCEYRQGWDEQEVLVS